MANQFEEQKGNARENMLMQSESSDKALEADMFMEVKFDKALQSFLERRGHERFDITKMEADMLDGSTDNIDSFDFIHISRINYDRQKDISDRNLIDFQQILSAAASRGGRFAYLIDSDINGVNLYLGMSKDYSVGKESLLVSKKQADSTLLSDTFKGIYPGSETKTLKSSPLDSSLAYSKAMLGIPSLKRDSDKDFKQSLEKILFPLYNKRFRIMLVAESYHRESIQEIIGNLFALGSEVHSLVKQSKNKQGSLADTRGSGVTDTKGSSRTDTEGSSETRTKGSSITHTTGSSVTDTEGSSITKTTGSSETRTKGSSTTHTKGSSIEFGAGGGASFAMQSGSFIANTLKQVIKIGIVGSGTAIGAVGGAFRKGTTELAGGIHEGAMKGIPVYIVGAIPGAIIGGATAAASGLIKGFDGGATKGYKKSTEFADKLLNINSVSLSSFRSRTNGGKITESQSISKTQSQSISKTKSESESFSTSKSTSFSTFESHSESEFESESFSTNKSQSVSTNESRAINTNEAQTKTITFGITYEELNKHAEYCEKLIEEYIQRFQKGLNHGLWNTSLYIQSDDLPTLSQVEHTLKSVYSGDTSYFEPLRFSDVIEANMLIESNQCELHKLPMFYAKDYENPIHTSFSGFSTAINTEELSLLAAMPTKDIQGLQVSHSSHFALTQSPINKNDTYIHIGNVLQRGERTPQRFRISLNALNHHLFVSGITGGGKSNSIKQILCRLQNDDFTIPFLVIEPAKSEYKHLKNTIQNLQIFSPGSSNDILRLNPFVFERQSELTSHVDLLKATFIAAFPMEGPMPYILESALHRIYTDKGWDFMSESHPLFVDSKHADTTIKSLLFPTMNDLYSIIDSVVAESGYASEIDSNLKAALKTRIKNLTLGIKGKIYNTRHCVSSELLFNKPTIIELSNIADDCEKSFLMGILLNRLYQYRQYQGDSNNTLKHICVIEEAHRLLPNIALEKSGSEANAKGAAVQVFINMLAEIRSYGEGLIIADQIASKLHRDVIKNTGTKIVHRTMDKEDRDIIGHSINLRDEQILDIATLQSGQAIVHNNEVHEAFMVGIDKIECNVISGDTIERFYNKFLESHGEYKYEYLFEQRYELSYAHELVKYIKGVNLARRKRLLLNIFNDILLNRGVGKIQNSLKSFGALLDGFRYESSIGERKGMLVKIGQSSIFKAMCYLFMETFRHFSALGNASSYKSMKNYTDIMEVFCDLLLALKDNNVDEIKACLNDMQQYFLHSKIYESFPSMNGYSKDKIDYTLLLLENMILHDRFKQELDRRVNINLKEHYTKTLQAHFKLNVLPYGFVFCLAAVRCGNEEINIAKLL